MQGQRATPLVPFDEWLRITWRRAALLGAGDVALAARAHPPAFGEVGDSSWARARAWARLRSGFDGQSGAARAGTMQRVGSETLYPGPRVLSDRSTPLLISDVAASLTRYFAAGIETAFNDEGASVRAGYAIAQWRALQLWAGRRPYGFAVGPASSIVLNANTPFTGGGFALRDGIALPIVRRVYVDGMIARLPENGPVEHPWFLASRVTLAPQPGLAIGLNRAAIFGGEDELSITPWRVLLMLLGRPDYPGKDSDFENQVASVDVLWRLRVGDVPLALHGEWGTDDTGFAFWYVPGLIAGVEMLQVPGAPKLALGVEGVYFGNHEFKYPPWYRHAALADGWSVHGRLLGHPLGGDGLEGALQAQYFARAVTLNARGFARHRGAENLFAPDRAGNSVGGEVGLAVPWRWLQLELRAAGEHGDGWQAGALRVLAGITR